MKKITKVLLTIEAVSSVYVLVRLGLTWLNARNPKTLEKEITDIFEENVDEIVSDLGLAKRPTLVFNNDHPTTVMATVHIEHTEGLIIKRIISTETKYEIIVNLENVKKMFLKFSLLSFNKKELHNALIRQLLLHECRHIWQAQGDFFVGQERNCYTAIIKGYGESPEETDANNYAISKAKDMKEKALFKYVKIEQDAHDKMFNDHGKELVVASKEMRKAWMPLFGLFS